jgi:hypothetical protein
MGPSRSQLISPLLPPYETHYHHDNNGHVNFTCSTVTAGMRQQWDHDDIEHIILIMFCGDYGNKMAMKHYCFSQFAWWECV